MTLRRSLYARPGSSDDSGAPLVRHPAKGSPPDYLASSSTADLGVPTLERLSCRTGTPNGVRGVRAQMRRRPERPYPKANCPESTVSATATNLRQYDGSAEPQPRHTGSSECGPGRAQGQTNRRQARLEVASAGDTPLLKTYNSVWQPWLAALDHATGWVLHPA